jgi:ribonucleoside-diphosphate reductase alpha chain
MAKEGSTVSGLMDSFATAISISLQYGVPLRDLVHKFSHVRFEPSGFTGNQEIPIAKSIVDYIFRWLGSKFLEGDDRDSLGIIDRTADMGADGSSSSADSAPAPLGALAAEPLGSPSRSSAEESAPSAAAPLAPATDSSESPSVAEPPKAEGTTTATAEAVAPAAPTNGHATNGNGHSRPTLVQRKGDAVALAFGTKRLAFQIDDAPSCSDCGSIMVRNGSCYKCVNCGSTSGCS